MTDTRTLKQVAKSVATMRRRVATAVRKHAKLQARIQKLQADGRIVRLSKDAPIMAGEGCWYVKAESLNTDADAVWNWYYQVLFIEEYGVYQCSCEDIRQCDCKHAVALGASFEQAAKRERYNMAFDPCLVA